MKLRNKISGEIKEFALFDGNELVIHFEDTNECQDFYNKLLAWKRLKEKGFRLEGWQFLDDKPGIWVRGNTVPNIVDELNIIFGVKNE